MESVLKPASRSIPKKLQVEVFRRDGWLCHWCGRPVVFAPTMKYLAHLARSGGFAGPLAYHHAHWTRRDAPLLDYMGAVIDHVEAYTRGGKNDETNLVTACCKCNALKSDAKCEVFQANLQRHTVKGRYGEPIYWDGLSALFVVLIELNRQLASPSERDWLKHLQVNVGSVTQT
jgi:5-methylcytosine-specific restriction endonuclease McrA